MSSRPGVQAQTSRRRWLRQLDGYHVISSSGPLGSIVRVEEDAAGVPSQLLVRTGLFIRRIVSVPIRSLIAIVPRRRRVIVDWRNDRG